MAEIGTNPGLNQDPAGPQGNAGEGSQQGGAPKLIAGKFKTMEEAVEQGYLGLERGYHELGEKVGALTRVLESAMNAPPPVNGGVPVGQSRPNVDAYGRNVDPDDIDAAQLLSDPKKIFAARDAKLMEQVSNVVGNVVSNAMAVNDFKARNRDLIPHERVVQTFMRDLDPRQFRTTAERLEEAGRLTREYLTTVRGGPDGVQNRVPSGGEYVEPVRTGPVSGGPPVYNPSIPQPDAKTQEEKELLDYIKERNDRMAQHFGLNMPK